MKAKICVLIAIVVLASVNAGAWGAQGHRLVALVAARRLAPAARESVTRLLGDETLSDVSSWADQYLGGNTQTALWHYLNIPPDATGYDRDCDCPLQPGVTAGSRNDVWRDSAVDRILLLAKAALLAPHASVDETYYRAQIPVIDKRLALAGLRLAALLNATFTTAPPLK
jgi:hypothetical protein